MNQNFEIVAALVGIVVAVAAAVAVAVAVAVEEEMRTVDHCYVQHV